MKNFNIEIDDVFYCFKDKSENFELRIRDIHFGAYDFQKVINILLTTSQQLAFEGNSRTFKVSKNKIVEAIEFMKTLENAEINIYRNSELETL